MTSKRSRVEAGRIAVETRRAARWLSANLDKAFAEKLYLLFLPVFLHALYFVVSFPNVYRLDERPDGPPWTLSRTVVEASFVAMTSLLLLDLWARFVGPIA